MRNLIKFFKQFRGLIGKKIYLLLILVSVAGFIEGLGITLFLPILQSGFGDDRLSQALKFMFDFFHVKFSFALMLYFIAAVFMLRSVFLIAYTRYFGRISANLNIRLRKELLEDVFAADYVYILKKEVGFIINAVVREISRVVEAFDTFAYMLNYSLFALIYIILSMLLNPRLTLLVILVSPFLMIAMRWLNRRVNSFSYEMSSSYGRFHSILIQALNKLKYVKSTFSHPRLSREIERENERVSDLTFRMAFLHALSKEAFEPVIVLIVVTLLFYHVVILQKNVGEVIFLSFLFLQIARQFISAQSSYRRFISSIGSIDTFNNFQNELKKNREDLNTEREAPDFTKDIIFRDTTVVFPNGKKALDNVNIRIRPRSVVALVGHSGSGKSTIANMLAGIIKPTSGDLLFGAAKYSEVNLKALRERIGYVTQEDIIFSASIKDNISLWGERIDEDRLSKVIEMAHITSFLKETPDGKDAVLGDSGLEISGGQRQRITIARELYKDSRLLIMDEATSSLDSKAENRIYENLKALKGNKTMVVIAHRLSTVKNADYIYVIDDGRVIEEGTYEDLRNRRGEFTRMVEDQKLT